MASPVEHGGDAEDTAAAGLADQLAASTITDVPDMPPSREDYEPADGDVGAMQQMQMAVHMQQMQAYTNANWQQVELMQINQQVYGMRPRYQQPRSAFPPPNYVCKICGVPGHWIQRCPQSSDPTKTSTTPPPGYVCRACNTPGHWIQQCPARMNQRPRDYTGAPAAWDRPLRPMPAYGRPAPPSYPPGALMPNPYGQPYGAPMAYPPQPMGGFHPSAFSAPNGAPQAWTGQAGPPAYTLPDARGAPGFRPVYAAPPGGMRPTLPPFDMQAMGSPPAPQPNEDALTLWMGDLQPWMTDKFLSHMFGQATNEKVTAKVHIDKFGRLSTFGFIKFPTAAAAMRAMAMLNGKPIPGTNRFYRLNWAQRKTSSPPGSAGAANEGTNSPGTSTPAEGAPSDAAGPPREGSASLAGADADEGGSGAGAGHMSEHLVAPVDDENAPLGEEAEDGSLVFTIFVGNLAHDVDQTALVSLFAQRYASVRGGRVVVNPSTYLSKGFGFVTFDNREDAARAMTEMQGQLCGDRPIRISPAKRRVEARQMHAQAPMPMVMPMPLPMPM